MHYNKAPLSLTDTSITDALGTIELKELPEPQPKCAVRLKGTTPLVERLWRIALSDIEKNVVETPDGCYLGAGKSFGVTVYTRDISYSGILGVNALYPDLMLNSIRAFSEDAVRAVISSRTRLLCEGNRRPLGRGEYIGKGVLTKVPHELLHAKNR